MNRSLMEHSCSVREDFNTVPKQFGIGNANSEYDSWIQGIIASGRWMGLTKSRILRVLSLDAG